jgi:hypothetical protein
MPVSSIGRSAREARLGRASAARTPAAGPSSQPGGKFATVVTRPDGVTTPCQSKVMDGPS